MALTIRFGDRGVRKQYYLEGTDIAPLPNKLPGVEPVPGTLAFGPFTPPFPAEFAGVAYSIGADGRATFDIVGARISPDNAQAISADAEALRLVGFKHVDADVGRGAAGDSEVVLIGAKQGNVATGDGDDSVEIAMLNVGGPAPAAFRIATGDGDDTVLLRGLEAPEIAGDPTYARLLARFGTDLPSGGERQESYVDLGDGDDSLTGWGSRDDVVGGAGDDSVDGGGGRDSFRLAGEQADYAISTFAGTTTIVDLDLTDGDDGTDEISNVETIRFNDGTLNLVPGTGFNIERVGYYDMTTGGGAAFQIEPIRGAGLTAVDLDVLTASSLADVDALLVTNESNTRYDPEYLAARPAIAAWVAAGGVLFVFDRFVTDAETILPGAGDADIIRDTSNPGAAEIDFVDLTGPFANGPGGLLDNDALDGGNSSSHGFTIAGTTPDGALTIQVRDGTDRIVTFAYQEGQGAVVYSTIPMDFYLKNGSGVGASMTDFATNVVAAFSTGDDIFA